MRNEPAGAITTSMAMPHIDHHRTHRTIDAPTAREIAANNERRWAAPASSGRRCWEWPPANANRPSMDADSLRAVQAPIKDHYRADPFAAIVTLRASGLLDDPQALSCSVDTGRALVTAGLHPATGGDGLLACSGDMLLQALVACAGVTLRAVSTATGIPVRGGAVHASGDLDFRGTLGVDREAPVGFKNIALTFDLETDATPDQVATLRKLTERYCVVYQTLAGGVVPQTEFRTKAAAV